MIESFQGEYRFLSNFWPCKVKLDGQEFQSVEHAYCAAKTNNHKAREQFQGNITAGQAKKLGRSLPLREDWESVKIAIMEELVHQKFSQEPLRSQLLATGDQRLIEGNTWGDHFWGMCNGEGLNWLGIIIMKVRKELQNAESGDSEDS